jgi:nucleotide-binding universal stress UspA family protein
VNYRGLVISTIVVGYDGAEPASHALDRAIEEARSARAQLLVVAVAEMPLTRRGRRTSERSTTLPRG